MSNHVCLRVLVDLCFVREVQQSRQMEQGLSCVVQNQQNNAQLGETAVGKQRHLDEQ